MTGVHNDVWWERYKEWGVQVFQLYSSWYRYDWEAWDHEFIVKMARTLVRTLGTGVFVCMLPSELVKCTLE